MTNLIVISSEVDLENEDSLLNDLFHEGLELFHLRKPHWKIEDQRTFLQKIKPEFFQNISIHQHHETVKEFGLKYYHVKEKQRKEVALSSSKGTSAKMQMLPQAQHDRPSNDIKYSTSFHDYTDLQFQSIFWDYCFLSPVFDSISKPEYKSSFKSDFNIEGDLNQRVFALGGINKNNITQVFKKEFFGAAVLGTIWSEPKNAVNNFKELKALCKQNVHTH